MVEGSTAVAETAELDGVEPEAVSFPIITSGTGADGPGIMVAEDIDGVLTGRRPWRRFLTWGTGGLDWIEGGPGGLEYLVPKLEDPLAVWCPQLSIIQSTPLPNLFKGVPGSKCRNGPRSVSWPVGGQKKKRNSPHQGLKDKFELCGSFKMHIS
jgi:hypothetical protein